MSGLDRDSRLRVQSIMPDYLSGRQNVIPEAQPGHLNSLLEAVAIQFGTPWLTANDGNPIQLLWQRRDGQSTNELLLLGDAIVNLTAKNSSWVARQIREIKEGDAGRRAGAVFELLGLNLFCGPNQRVEPAPENNPGYDGKVFFADGSSLMLSIKNHGISSAELNFREKAAGIHIAYVETASRHNRNGFIRNVALRHPLELDWQELRARIDGIVAVNDREPEGSIWAGWIRPIPDQFSSLSPQHLSYVFQIAVPYHPNEQNNFYENIRRGIANLERHHAVVANDVCRALMLRLSATASIPKCIEWTEAYFRDFPQTAVELILIYQAVPATDLTTETTAITHFFAPVPGPGFAAWQAAHPARRFTITTLVGKVSTQPARLAMTDGREAIPLDDLYLFQNGHIFRFYPAGNLPVNATLSSPAPGILVHAVIEGLGGLQMIAPPNAELVLLP
jgi:hypothetical protein